MAFTRKFLSAMGIEDDKIEQIMDAHVEVTTALKQERDTAKEKAAQYDTVKAELDGLKSGTDYKAKYEQEHINFEAYKTAQTAKETKTAKEAAVRAYFEAKGITGANLAIAMRGAVEEINATELDNGKIKDTAKLDALVSGDYAGLIGKTETKGADTAHPANVVGNSAKLTREEIYKTDERGRFLLNASERQAALAELMDAGE